MSTQIGLLQFDIGRGAIHLSQNNIVPEVRPGQDGITVFAMGNWGQPFDFQTESYHNTFTNGEIQAQAARAMIGITPVVLIHETINYSLTPWFTVFVVQNVKITERKTIPFVNQAVNHSGAAQSPATRVVLNWTLIPKTISG